ncbi:hypothetical protein ESOMN_v1c03490 [Williamsoniiplasma somnilux]|uniref:Uncharacterized protein n=1 Tax=Williamsoniiplasma somnilux TaxID=215578 RepID=A0A2K8P150_9MOLU|nr:MFS transporter [Williamsoniiplasma somnilux]ATZ18731.1 hypothetical protein ESOMN_v1c03490 [Williamsoniiplasma somnilux]
MNIKTYAFTKYIATLGSIFIFTAPLLGFLQQWRNIFSNVDTMVVVISILLAIGITTISIYISLRLYLKHKSSYKYEHKDLIYLTISIISYISGVIAAIIYVVIAIIWKENHANQVMIAFGPTYPIVWIGMILGAIFESLSRINEQIKIYQEREKKVNQQILAKRKQIVDDESDKDEIRKEIDASRTSDAEKLLLKGNETKKVDKKKESKKVEPKNDTNEYNPFMDSKLNKELKDNQDIKKWLNEKDKK